MLVFFCCCCVFEHGVDSLDDFDENSSMPDVDIETGNSVPYIFGRVCTLTLLSNFVFFLLFFFWIYSDDLLDAYTSWAGWSCSCMYSILASMCFNT